MANCGFRIFKDGTSYGIGINVSDATDAKWSSFDNSNLYVNGNATISGNATFKAYPILQSLQYPGLYLEATTTGENRMGAIFMTGTTVGTSSRWVPQRMGFREYSYNSSTGTVNTDYSETFYLPAVTSGLSEAKSYYILTNKSAITIAQGGTGATTSDDAISNLGLARKSFTPAYTTNDLVTDLSGLTIYTVAGIAFLCINMTPTSASNASFVNIGTIPTGARPPIQVQTRIAQGVSGAQVGFRVTAAGTISLYKGTTSTTGFYGVFSYPVA